MKALWWRKLQESRTPDADLPLLSRRDADALRQSIVQALKEHGALVRFEADSAIITHARRGVMQIELGGLMREVASSEHPKAARIAARNAVDALFTEQPFTEMSTADLYRGLRLRLVPSEEVRASASNHAVVFPFTDDTEATLVLDTESSVQSIPLEELTEIDGLDTLTRAGRANLVRELGENAVSVTQHKGNPTQEGSYFWSIESDSLYTSSGALAMEELLPLWMPRLDTSEGVIFAMPTKYALLVRQVTSGHNLIEGLGAIAAVAHEVAQRSDNPVSPLIHTSYMGGIDTVSSWDEGARQLTITPTPHLLGRIQS